MCNRLAPNHNIWTRQKLYETSNTISQSQHFDPTVKMRWLVAGSDVGLEVFPKHCRVTPRATVRPFTLLTAHGVVLRAHHEMRKRLQFNFREIDFVIVTTSRRPGTASGIDGDLSNSILRSCDRASCSAPGHTPRASKTGTRNATPRWTSLPPRLCEACILRTMNLTGNLLIQIPRLQTRHPLALDLQQLCVPHTHNGYRKTAK